MNRDARADTRLVVELKSRGLSNYRIADLIGCHEKTVRRILEEAQYEPHLLPVNDVERFLLTLDAPLTLKDEDAMVTADWHIPIYNPWLVNDLIERARFLNIRTLVIGGDFFNFDALSAYDPKQEEAGLEREIDEARKVMLALKETFTWIYFTWGNHDARLHKALGYRMKFANAMRLLFEGLDFPGLYISNLDHMHMEYENTGRWRICHPATYSRVPLSTPRTLAAKFNTNVICAHAHHAAVGYASDGIKVVAEIGGLFDQHKTQYLQRTTTFPTWTPGYGWFKDGHFHMTSPGWTT